MISFIQKKYANHILKPWLLRHLQKPRMYEGHGLNLIIYPSVFHPKYFFSTQLLVTFLNTLNVKGKTFCEVGAGSGLVSFCALKKKAVVTALELNETAVKGLKENLQNNFTDDKNFRIVHSDLFSALGSERFDILFINPPYFFRTVNDESSMAWNCGENGEYFTKLFSSLENHSHSGSGIYMILADNCDIERIKGIAAVRNFTMTQVLERKIKWENNFIFKLNYKRLAGTE